MSHEQGNLRWLTELTVERDRYKAALEKISDDSWYKNEFVPAEDEQARRAILMDRMNEVKGIAHAALHAPRAKD